MSLKESGMNTVLRNRWARPFGLVLVLLAMVFFAGCASVPMASADADAAAKRFESVAGKSTIYIYRNEVFGGAVALTVSMDGKIVGRTGSKTFFALDVDPGAHEISSIAENTSTLKLNTAAGKRYFVWQEVKMGLWQPRSQLHEVDEATGRKAVLECKRLAPGLE
jgi:hypothetical protein